MKFLRAAEHRQRLETELDRLVKDEANQITFKGEVEWEQPTATCFYFSIGKAPHFPPEVGPMVGDVVHNLRSALDHLTWELVKRGTQPRPKDPKGVQFPFATSWASFKAQLERRLPGVADRPHRALVRRYQPYRRDPRGRGMHALRYLNDTDKHRVLLPTVMAVDTGRLTFHAPGASQMSLNFLLVADKMLKHGTPVARVVAHGLPGAQHEVQVQGTVTATPSLGYRRPARLLLRHIEALVFELLDSFDRIELGPRYKPHIVGLSVDRKSDDPLRGLI